MMFAVDKYAFALFVPTSSAALGIAFKASLMLCSHLHEQSGRGLPPYTRLPRVSLRLPWAKRSLGFQPVIPDAAYLILLSAGRTVLWSGIVGN